MHCLKVLLVLAVCGICACGGRPSHAAPPNVVLILSDDQAWTDYGFMGHPHIQTPHLDRLASQSRVFTRGYVPDSLCRPSLASIITGRYPHQHGIVGNDPPVPQELAATGRGRAARDPKYLVVREKYIGHIDDEATLPKLLGQHLGYESLQTGKWWEGNYSRGGFTHGMTHGDMTRGARHGDEGLKIGREGLDPIFKFIKEATAEERPFFIWYAPMLPHTPHDPPERLLKKYINKTPHEPVAKYWAMCEWWDETCGELLDHLDTQGLTDNTIVVYVTDNGWINKTDVSAFAPKSKRSQYDGGIRTPIMIRWPGHVEPKLDKEQLASSLDIVPTVLAAVGVDAPQGLPGINLLDDQAVAGRNTVYGEIFEHDIRHMTDPVPSLMYRWVIDGNWKLIVPLPAVVPDGKVELYNLGADPHEESNLAATDGERVRTLTEKLDSWWTP